MAFAEIDLGTFLFQPYYFICILPYSKYRYQRWHFMLLPLQHQLFAILNCISSSFCPLTIGKIELFRIHGLTLICTEAFILCSIIRLMFQRQKVCRASKTYSTEFDLKNTKSKVSFKIRNKYCLLSYTSELKILAAHAYWPLIFLKRQL